MASLGVDQLKTYLDASFSEAVEKLIAESGQTAFVLDNIRLLEKVSLCQGYMIDLANNFVSFPDLYDTAKRAMFEMGTLVMDARRFNLAVKVENRAEHTQVAKTSNMFVLYVQITPRNGIAPYEVAVPITAGSQGNLCKGKRGVFYDIQHREADAQVVHIIQNPISFREALASPFRRLAHLLSGKIESIATDAEKKLDSQATTTLNQVAPAGSAPPPAKPGMTMATGGLFMGAGVAIAALGSAVAYITKTLAGTNPLAIVAGLLAAILLVMLPMCIVAFLKLRKRDLSAILEGSGWGINAPMRLTHKQGLFFANRPRYPKQAKGVSQFPWRGLVIALIVLAALTAGTCLLRRHKARQAARQAVETAQPQPDQTTQTTEPAQSTPPAQPALP